MNTRPNGKKAYQVLVDPQVLKEIKKAKERGLNLQPLVREFIKVCIEKNKSEAGVATIANQK